MEDGVKLFSLTNLKAIAGILILVFLLIYIFKNRKSCSVVFFSILWFLIALLPVSNIYPINAYMREHWLYVPSIGFFLILADRIRYLYNRKKFYVIGMAFILGLLTFYSYLTIKQNEYWKEPISFYKRSLIYAPHNFKLYANLGNTYDEIGKKEEAIAAYKKALEINPNFAEAYNNLGVVYYKIGKKEEAIAVYKKALEINPDYAIVYFKLSIIYFYENKYELAFKYCDRAIKLGFNVPVDFMKKLKEYKKKDNGSE